MQSKRVDVEVFASRDLELGRHAAGLGTSRNVEVFVSRAPELWRCDAGVASLCQEIWRRAAGVRMCRSLPQELCAAGVGTSRYRDRDLGRHAVGLDILAVWRFAAGVLPLFASIALELQRRAAGVGTWRCLPQEIGSSGAALQACRRGGICLKSPGGLDAV